MTQPARSTWPEALYALSLTKTGGWHAQRIVMDLVCAHASAQGVVSGPFECSHRDLASHLYRSEDSGHSAAGRLMTALVERGVLRELSKGSGTAPSEWDVAHWTRWDVPWRIREATAHDRVSAFAACHIRPQGGISGRIFIRSLAKTARAVSAEIASLAVSSIDEGARSSTAVSMSQVTGSQLDRYGFSEDPATIYIRESKDSLSREQKEREEKLIDAFKRGALMAEVFGLPLEQLKSIAAMANGSFDEVCRQAADPSGPTNFLERLALLRQFAESPKNPRGSARNFAHPPDRRRQGLESTLRGLELCGEGETVEAYELREQLATLDACEPKPE